MTSKAQWQKVWRVVKQVTGEFPEDSVLIGGVAVYLHTKNVARPEIPMEFTQDADLYLGQNAWPDLRDAYVVTTNRRLSKHQITVGDVEVDLYIGRQHKLRVNYEDLAAAAQTIDGIKVAALEHLLLLKLSAFAARGTTPHGEKDRRDLAKILVLLEGTPPFYTVGQMEEEEVALLDGVMKSSAFLEISNNNAHRAAQLRKQASVYLGKLKRAHR